MPPFGGLVKQFVVVQGEHLLAGVSAPGVVVIWSPLVDLSGCELGHVGVVVDLLKFDGCQPAEGAVTALAVVEDFEVFEDRVRELDAGAPAASVQELDLHARPEALDDGVVVAVAD
jgi:hypothetical protein